MPSNYYSTKTKPFAQHLRKNATPEENHLWYDFLHDYPVRFRRQKQIGNYIVDFYCAKAKLAIELDGSQHYSEDGMAHDGERTEVLNRCGVEVLRFCNLDIKQNFEGVCFMIDKKVEELTGIVSGIF